MNFTSVIPDPYIPRLIETDIEKFINDREIIVLRGPRQSGKTTLLLTIKQRLAEKYGEQHVVFITFEDELERKKFEQNPREYLTYYQRITSEQRIFVFLDEVQYVANAGKVLKLLYDAHPNLKLFVSGSSTLDLTKLGEYLVGRAIFFELFPLSFEELLRFKDNRLYAEYKQKRFSFEKPTTVESLFINELNAILLTYLIYGGYPRICIEEDEEKKRTLLKNLFSTYIEKDVALLYGLQYKDAVIKTLQYLAGALGSTINLADVSQITNLKFHELKQTLSILEQTYVIAKLPPFHQNLVTEIKKQPKYYFFDSGMRSVLLNRWEFTPEEKGVLLEQYVFNRFYGHKRAFWRTTAKAEVDLILTERTIPLEVKLTPKITRSLTSFIHHYHPPFALVAAWQDSSQEQRHNTPIYTIPACLL